MEETSKIPTAAQIRKYLKDETHIWSGLERIAACQLLLPADVLSCIEDDDTTLVRLGGDCPDLKSKKRHARKRLEYLNNLLMELTIDCQHFEAIKPYTDPTPESYPLPPRLVWAIRRRNVHEQLMEFIHQIDKRRAL